MGRNNIDDLQGQPNPEQLLIYAESQAYRILRSMRSPPDKRTIAMVFVPSAQTNLEAVSEWILSRLLATDNLQCADLCPDADLAAKLEATFYERLEAAFISLSVFD